MLLCVCFLIVPKLALLSVPAEMVTVWGEDLGVRQCSVARPRPTKIFGCLTSMGSVCEAAMDLCRNGKVHGFVAVLHPVVSDEDLSWAVIKGWSDAECHRNGNVSRCCNAPLLSACLAFPSPPFLEALPLPVCCSKPLVLSGRCQKNLTLLFARVPLVRDQQESLSSPSQTACCFILELIDSNVCAFSIVVMTVALCPFPTPPCL